MFLIDITEFVNHSIQTKFAEILLIVSEIIALIFGVKYVRNDRIGQLFIFYILFDMLVMLANWTFISFDYVGEEWHRDFTAITNTLISLVELFVYYSFFFKVIENTGVKRIMRILLVVFFLLVLVYLITRFQFLTPRFSYAGYVLGSVEFLFLLLPCLSFIIEILQTNSNINLFQRPSFWVTTGILFFSLVSIPYYLIYRYMNAYRPEFKYFLALTLYYGPFAVNFLFLTKAFLCKRILTI